MVLYTLKNLVKRYDGRKILDLKSLDLAQGRVIGLLGPNGAGKTTLLEVLAFLLPPTQGEIRFQGMKVVPGIKLLMKLRRKVVLVQQQPILFTTSVSKNVEFPLKIRRVRREKRRRIVDHLLEVVGMGDFKERPAHKLSGGETQRAAIARALACGPEVILLDEPTSSVDVENQESIEHLIREINQSQGVSVIFTTHDMAQASRLADEILFMSGGKVQEQS